MKTFSISILLVLIGALGFESCKKYEEGPALSLRSKKERMANTWIIEKAYRDGSDVTNSYDNYELYMSKDGNAQLQTSYTFFNVQSIYETDGTWDFSDDKEELDLNFQDDDADSQYQILKLYEKELWLREVGGEDELHLMPK